MEQLLIHTLSIFIIPVTILSLIIVSLVLLFAREHAQGVLKQLYVYGVVITAFLVSTIAMICVLYTGLTTTLLPVNDSNTAYPRDQQLQYSITESTGADVKAYLGREQDRLNTWANAEDVRQEWRNQLAWSIPLLLVFLPILLSYRRFLTRA